MKKKNKKKASAAAAGILASGYAAATIKDELGSASTVTPDAENKDGRTYALASASTSSVLASGHAAIGTLDSACAATNMDNKKCDLTSIPVSMLDSAHAATGLLASAPTVTNTVHTIQDTPPPSPPHIAATFARAIQSLPTGHLQQQQQQHLQQLLQPQQNQQQQLQQMRYVSQKLPSPQHSVSIMEHEMAELALARKQATRDFDRALQTLSECLSGTGRAVVAVSRHLVGVLLIYAREHPTFQTFLYVAGGLSVLPISLFLVYSVITLCATLFTAGISLLFFNGTMLTLGLAVLLPTEVGILLVAGGVAVAYTKGTRMLEQIQKMQLPASHTRLAVLAQQAALSSLPDEAARMRRKTIAGEEQLLLPHLQQIKQMQQIQQLQKSQQKAQEIQLQNTASSYTSAL